MFCGLRLESGDRVITRFQTRKSGALLAYLALNSHRAISREDLAELFWPDVDPAAAGASLRTAIASLRRQLEPPGVAAGAVLEASRSTIGLRPGSVATDVDSFRRTLKAAADAAAEEDKLAQLTAAIDCYTGLLLPEYFEDWVESERSSLAQACLGAIRRAVRMLARRKDYDRAITYARQAVAADLLCEESHRDLISLYALAGRQSAALNQYSELAALLTKELGAQPSSTTRKLAARIQAELGHRANRANAMTPKIAGLEKSESLAHSDRAELSVSASPSLPVSLNRFFGREKEMDALRGLLSPVIAEHRDRLVTLTGAGGCGKTRLAIEAASRAVDTFSGAVWFAPLAEIDDRRRIPGALLSALRIPPPKGVDPLDQLTEALADRPALLVLDNFEQIAAGSGVVERILNQTSQLKCLVTSRRRLGIPGERVIDVSPLAIPNGSKAPEDILKYPAVQLFVDRAQAARPDFQITAGNAAAIAALCRSLEGIPLAIELAAARAQSLTPAQMLERLSVRFESLLTSRRNDREARHSSLWAAIDWSYHLLTPEQQRLFARLSVFAGGWTAEAAEEVCQEQAAVEYLSQLRERSMIVAAESKSDLRFRMLESLREFAALQVNPAEREELGRRHARHFLRLAETAEAKINGREAAQWLDRMEDEYGNLRASLIWSVANDGEIGLNLAGALWSFLRARGHLAEEREILGDLLERYPDAPAGLRAKALTTAGILACSQGDTKAGRILFERSLSARREVGWGDGIASALSNLGVAAFDSGDYELARSSYEEAIELTRAAGNEWRAAVAINNLGNVARATGDNAGARTLLEESLEMRRRLGDRRGIATSLNNLGQAELALGEPNRARELQEESLEIYRELADKPGIAYASDSLGQLCLLDGDIELANVYFVESLKLRVELRDKREIATSLDWFAEVAAACGNPKRAVYLWAAAERLRRESSCPPTPAQKERRDLEIEKVRGTLSPTAFAASWSEGSNVQYQRIVDGLVGGNYESGPNESVALPT